MEATQVSVAGWLDKPNGVHPHSGTLLSPEKERSSDTGYHVDGPWTLDAEWNELDTKGPTLYDSTPRTSLEEYRSIEMESRTVGALGGWEVSVSWGQSFGFARWKILERMVVMAAQGCECISCHLKEVSIVHFMWCVFYHQTKKNLFRKERFASTRAFRPTGSDLEPFTNHYSPDKMLKCVHQKTFCGGFVNF